MAIMDHINDIKERIKELEATQSKLSSNIEIVEDQKSGINKHNISDIEDYKVLAAHYGAKEDINLDALDIAVKLYISYRFDD